MLPSQRALFDIPRDVCYMNAASWGPLPLVAQEAARAAVARKARPWELSPDLAATQHERARAAAARLINADPDDVALISSVSYGVATAAKALPVPAGARVIVLQDDHSSPVLEWISRAPAEGFTVEAIPQPPDGDWTSAVLAGIERQEQPLSLWPRCRRCIGPMVASLAFRPSRRPCAGKARPCWWMPPTTRACCP